MHFLRYDPELRTIHEVPESEYGKDPCCRYFHVEGKRITIPCLTPAGWGEIVWQHPDWQPPSPFKIKRRPWIIRLIRARTICDSKCELGCISGRRFG